MKSLFSFLKQRKGNSSVVYLLILIATLLIVGIVSSQFAGCVGTRWRRRQRNIRRCEFGEKEEKVAQEGEDPHETPQAWCGDQEKRVGGRD